MSPQDEGQLMARLRALPKSVPVQTLITPDLAAPPEPKRWGYGKRRPVVAGACDPAEFIAQVNAYLELTRERRADGPMFRGTDGAERRAATRHDCPRRPLALVNGAEATVIDVSSTGAQIVASSVLVPGRLVDVVVENGDRLVRCRASVIWGSFEAGDSDDPVRYRAGIDFTDG